MKGRPSSLEVTLCYIAKNVISLSLSYLQRDLWPFAQGVYALGKGK